MDRYLYNHYKGKYRVYAHYDLDTLDFPRDPVTDGYDESFADFYLKGKSKIEIKHGTGSELSCYIPSKATGYNVIRSYYKALADNTEDNVEVCIHWLNKNGYINDCDILDSELFFTFHMKHLDILAPIVKLKTSGANISPLSIKNLPKNPYVIPDVDIKEYKKLIKDKQGFEILRLAKEFANDVLEIESFNKVLKKERLKANQYFHKTGEWNKWIDFLRGNI